MALYLFQGVANSCCVAPLSLEGEGLGERSKTNLFLGE